MFLRAFIVCCLCCPRCRTDIVHAHDWATAPVAFAGDLAGAKAVFTIHNLNYGADLIGRAMAASAAATTVSPTYAAEVGSQRDARRCPAAHYRGQLHHRFTIGAARTKSFLSFSVQLISLWNHETLRHLIVE